MVSFMTPPRVKVIAGSKTDTTIKVDLPASYADVGNIVAAEGASDLTLQLEEILGTEDAIVKFFLSPDGAQPTATTGLYQLVDSAGAEIEVAIIKNTKQMYALQSLSTKWLALQGRGNATPTPGTAADLRAFLVENIKAGWHFSEFKVPKIAAASVVTALGASPALVGNIIDVKGLGNLTAFVKNSDASVNATLTPYYSWETTKPTALSAMVPLDDTAGAKRTFVTLANENAAHPLGGVTARWLAFEGSGNGADVTIFVLGTPEGFGGA